MPAEEHFTRLTVKVSPGAARSEITGFRDDALRIRVAAAPEKGKANRELIDFISGKLGIRKSDITILRGETSRTKILEIRGIDHDQLLVRLKKEMKEGA